MVITRDEFFKRLYNSPMYKAARAALKDKAKQRQLDMYMQEKFSSVAESLANISKYADSDSERFKEDLRQALKGGDEVVINETAETSGSSG